MQEDEITEDPIIKKISEVAIVEETINNQEKVIEEQTFYIDALTDNFAE